MSIKVGCNNDYQMKLHMMHFDFFGRVARMQTWVVWADETAS
jgi:hypothetical protein